MLIGGSKSYLSPNGNMFEFYIEIVLDWLWGTYDNKDILIVGTYWRLKKILLRWRLQLRQYKNERRDRGSHWRGEYKVYRHQHGLGWHVISNYIVVTLRFFSV